MSADPNEGRSSGRLVSLHKALPAVEVDCSGWERDVPEEQWSTGRLVSLHKALPAVEVDCSGWAAGATVWLELVVSFDQRTPPARVMEHANQLIAAAARAAPELGLTYDFTRSRAEKGDVVIALTPRNTTDVERRLKEVAEVFRGETARSDEVRRLVATVAHAA